MTIDKKSPDYYAGLRDGIKRFAWWKDGTQYVGSGGTPLAEALKETYKEELLET